MSGELKVWEGKLRYRGREEALPGAVQIGCRREGPVCVGVARWKSLGGSSGLASQSTLANWIATAPKPVGNNLRSSAFSPHCSDICHGVDNSVDRIIDCFFEDVVLALFVA